MNLPPKLLTCLVLSLAVLSLPSAAAAQGFRWWQNQRFQTELALTAEQVTRLEDTYQALRPTLRNQKETFDKLEARLSRVINDPASDEAKVLTALERVEAARGELSRSRTLLTFRMRRILTEEQNIKLKALHEQWERERRNRTPSHNHRG